MGYNIDQCCCPSSIAAFINTKQRPLQNIKALLFIPLTFSNDNHDAKIKVGDVRRVMRTAGCIATNSILKMNNMIVTGMRNMHE